MHSVDQTHRGKSCVVFSVTNIFSVEQPLLLRKKRKEKIEERTSIFPRTWLTIYSWRVSCFPSTPCYNLLFSWHSLPTTVQHSMSCRTMEHQKRELWNHQLEDTKTNRVGETRRVEGFGKEAAFIYHKYRSARHAIYPTEEIKNPGEPPESHTWESCFPVTSLSLQQDKDELNYPAAWWSFLPWDCTNKFHQQYLSANDSNQSPCLVRGGSLLTN